MRHASLIFNVKAAFQISN